MMLIWLNKGEQMSELAKKIELEELIENLSTNDGLLQLDALLINSPQIECPLENQFYPGLYIRERFVPAGTLFTTYTWKTTHPFRCIMGELLIWEKESGWQLYSAPCKGITNEGTKRVIYAITDVIWETLHCNFENITDEKELHDMLFENYSNPYVSLTQLQEVNKCQEL
jgi:hypothetical protein